MSGFEGLYFRVITKLYRTSRPASLGDDITMPDDKRAGVYMVRLSQCSDKLGVLMVFHYLQSRIAL